MIPQELLRHIRLLLEKCSGRSFPTGKVKSLHLELQML